MACLAAARVQWAILYAVALDLLEKSPLNCMLLKWILIISAGCCFKGLKINYAHSHV
jgi:hypothetical protein